MPIVADAAVAVRGDLTGFNRDLKTAERTTMTLGQRLRTALSPRNLKIGAAFAAGAGAFAVVNILSDAIRNASDLNEEIDKSAVVFGDAAPRVQSFADSAADIGLSTQEALGAAGAFGNMFNTVGLAEDASADMSTTMVQLASDMASFNNEDPSAMLDRLRSGLAGEAEPLRRFGVLLSEAALQEFAIRTGIIAVGEALTEGQKVQARYGLILEQTAIQQGNFALTSGSLANQQRELQAKLTNVSAELGSKFLPIMVKVVGFVSDVVVPAIQYLIDNPLVALIAISPLIVIAITAIGSALLALISPVGLIVAAVVALFVAWQTNFLGIRDIVGNVVTWFVKNILPTLQQAFAVIVAVVSAAVGIAIELFKVWFTAWKTIIGTIVAVVSTGIGIVVAVIEAIVGVVEGVVSGVSDAIEMFKDIFDAAGKFIGPAVDLITAPIKAIVGIVAGVAEVVGGFFDWLFGKTDEAGEKLDSFNQTVKDLPGGTTYTPRPIPEFQHGAWEIPNNTPAFLHAGEMVVPKTFANLLRASGGTAGRPITVNVLDAGVARSVGDIGRGLRELDETGLLP